MATKGKTQKKKSAKKKATPKAPSRKRAESEPKFPYTTTPSALRKFLGFVPNKPRPSKINRETLKAWGIGDSNAQTIIRVLKTLALVDSSNEPTDVYSNFMHRESGAVALGERIKATYPQLFEAAHEPHRESAENLQNIFNIHSGGSERTMQYQIQTFKTLAEFASFSDVPTTIGNATTGQVTNGNSGKSAGVNVPQVATPTIHIDLHIHLPENKSRRDYECIFEDIERYIYGRQTTGSEDE